jgi:hypothetical protein
MAKKRRPRSKKPPLPRAPLPRQTGGAHEDKTKRHFRKDKHRKKWNEDQN